jgi:hypothetical protein
MNGALAVGGALALLLPASALGASAKQPDVQKFAVYDDTQTGLVAADDPVVGNVIAVANPGGQSRLLLTISLHKAVPNCSMYVELTRDYAETNGGLDANGHVGRIPRLGFTKVIGTLETNARGNGVAHVDIDPSAYGGASSVRTSFSPTTRRAAIRIRTT